MWWIQFCLLGQSGKISVFNICCFSTEQFQFVKCQDTWAGQDFLVRDNTWTLVILQTAVNCFRSAMFILPLFNNVELDIGSILTKNYGFSARKSLQWGSREEDETKETNVGWKFCKKFPSCLGWSHKWVMRLKEWVSEWYSHMGKPLETGNFETIYMFSWSTNNQLWRGTNLEKVHF